MPNLVQHDFGGFTVHALPVFLSTLVDAHKGFNDIEYKLQFSS